MCPFQQLLSRKRTVGQLHKVLQRHRGRELNRGDLALLSTSNNVLRSVPYGVEFWANWNIS
jgi:hypothetical protein